MGRHSCCYKQKLRKGLWSPEEDDKLLNYITKHGHGCWSSVPKLAGTLICLLICKLREQNYRSFSLCDMWYDILAGLQRCGKSCRLRWINYLRPDLKRGPFSQQEENLIIELHAVLGNRYFMLTWFFFFLLQFIFWAINKINSAATCQMVSDCCSVTWKDR